MMPRSTGVKAKSHLTSKGVYSSNFSPHHAGGGLQRHRGSPRLDPLALLALAGPEPWDREPWARSIVLAEPKQEAQSCQRQDEAYCAGVLMGCCLLQGWIAWARSRPR
jgi:hypothetical protein